MTVLGERLRARRLERGYSLAQTAAATRILERYIAALEDGDHHNLPGDVYTRGFIRNYAVFLELPADELIELYRSERGQTEPIIVQPTSRQSLQRPRYAPGLLGVFSAVLGLVAVSYLLLTVTTRLADTSSLVAEAPSTTPELVVTSAPVASIPGVPAATSTLAPIVLPTARPTATAEVAGAVVQPTPVPTQEAPIVFEVRIDPGNHPGSWLEIQADGVSLYRRTLGPGQTLRYTAQSNLSVRAGNAAVVSVVVNNQVQRLGDQPGEVVVFRYPAGS
jgi:cytoskeletal protein RodZ